MQLSEIQEKMLSPNLSKEDAIAIAQSGRYREMGMSYWAVLQLKQNKLCCDFNYFHECVEFACGRPVFTHEFAKPDLLVAEIMGLRKEPSLDEIIDMLPQDKLTIVHCPEN